jgi:activator of 2-hydroxyglutaryl-CoA dehydratase
VRALEARLETRVSVPEDPQLTGALGAAMIARDRLEEGDG